MFFRLDVYRKHHSMMDGIKAFKTAKEESSYLYNSPPVICVCKVAEWEGRGGEVLKEQKYRWEGNDVTRDSQGGGRPHCILPLSHPTLQCTWISFHPSLKLWITWHRKRDKSHLYLLQKFCVTLTVSLRLRTLCHQPLGINTMSPGFCTHSRGRLLFFMDQTCKNGQKIH